MLPLPLPAKKDFNFQNFSPSAGLFTERVRHNSRFFDFLVLAKFLISYFKILVYRIDFYKPRPTRNDIFCAHYLVRAQKLPK